MEEGDSLSAGFSDSAHESSFSIGGGLRVGDYRLNIDHRDLRVNQEGWPEAFQKTSLTLGRLVALENGKMVVFSLGAGVAAEKGSRTYTHVQPMGQLLYLSPPRAGRKVGYMAGFMAAPGASPLPLLMLLYLPKPSIHITLGFPFTSLTAELWEGGLFKAAASPSGLQRLSLTQKLNAQATVTLAYREEAVRFGHIAAWESVQVFRDQTRKLGLALDFQVSDRISFGIEGGARLRHRLERLSSRSILHSDVLQRQETRGGRYGQVSATVRY